MKSKLKHIILQQYVLFRFVWGIEGHKSNFTWFKKISEFDSKGRRIYDNTVSVQEPLGDVRTGSHSAQPTTSIALMFMQRKTELFWFYSEAFDLVLSVCWQPFNTVLQVQAFTHQAQVGQGMGMSVDDKCMEAVKGLFGKLHYLFQLRQFSMVPLLVPVLPHNPQPFAWCTCKCCLCQTEALGAFWKADEYITYSHKLDSDINNFKVHLFFVQEDQEVPCQQLQAVLDASFSKVSVSFKNHTFDKSFTQDNVRSGAGTISYFHS